LWGCWMPVPVWLHLKSSQACSWAYIWNGCESDVFVGSSLVDKYAKCGSIKDAWRLFIKMPSWDVFSWNAIILGHVKCGQGQKAVQLFQQMQQEDVLLDPVTFVRVLNACASVVML
jgi:pentatricopeptide repeat protein